MIFHKHKWVHIGQNKIISGDQLFKCSICGVYEVFNKYINTKYKTRQINMDNYNLKVNVKDYFKTNQTEQVSDGYHTFEELYEHRMKLFTVICNTYTNEAWKSKLHYDGTMYDDYFIVGITIPNVGDYTYHYHMKYWDEFRVKTLENAPKWDGHKPSDINRLDYLAG